MARPLNELSAREIVRGTAARDFTAEAVTRECLSRIKARDSLVKAWVFVDPEIALAQARARDRSSAKGPLHGVPVGIKDIIDVVDMPTEMGSPIYKDYRPGKDAASVALLRAAGAVILGKTVTCEFAGLTPNVTRNPRDSARTPGGSSSGSAAAVADVMAPLATGTQTGGSVIRPASFCGVVGYKPSFGLISRDGMKFAAESRDTIGTFARSVADTDLVAAVLTGRAPISSWPDAAPRIGLCRTHYWQDAAPETVNAVMDAAHRLAHAGASIRDVVLPENFKDLGEARAAVNPFERARAMAHEWNTKPELLSERLRRTVEEGLKIPHSRYVAALAMMKDRRDQFARLFDGVDILLAPCVKGEAPEGFEFTGEPRFQELWTALHVPAITIPTHTGPNGLPVGIQLIAPQYQDEKLLMASRWVFTRLGPGAGVEPEP